MLEIPEFVRRCLPLALTLTLLGNSACSKAVGSTIHDRNIQDLNCGAMPSNEVPTIFGRMAVGEHILAGHSAATGYGINSDAIIQLAPKGEITVIDNDRRDSEEPTPVSKKQDGGTLITVGDESYFVTTQPDSSVPDRYTVKVVGKCIKPANK